VNPVLPEEVPAVTLARIEGKLDHVIAQGNDHEGRIRVLEAFAQGASDHESRLKVVESRQWPVPSVALVLSLAAVIIPLVR
jgi:hypothetical protein